MSVAEVPIARGRVVGECPSSVQAQVQAEDIIKEMKRHSFYVKPGDKRRLKQALARKRARKKMRKESDWSSQQLGPLWPNRGLHGQHNVVR
jgi:small subunit ribosomal protein S21